MMKRFCLALGILSSVLTMATGAFATPAQGLVTNCHPSPAYASGTYVPLSVDLDGNTCQSGAGTVTLTTVTSTSRGGSIATGGTSQTLMLANAGRHGCFIQNPLSAADEGIATAETIYLNFASTAAAPASTSIGLAPGQSFVCDVTAGFVEAEQINVVGATTGHLYVAFEF